jgi:hypothetical protein
MHVLELSDADTRVLRRAVETRLREMRDEMAALRGNGGSNDFLKGDLDRLEKIGRVIGATVESEGTLY